MSPSIPHNHDRPHRFTCIDAFFVQNVPNVPDTSKCNLIITVRDPSEPPRLSSMAIRLADAPPSLPAVVFEPHRRVPIAGAELIGPSHLNGDGYRREAICAQSELYGAPRRSCCANDGPGEAIIHGDPAEPLPGKMILVIAVA